MLHYLRKHESHSCTTRRYISKNKGHQLSEKIIPVGINPLTNGSMNFYELQWSVTDTIFQILQKFANQKYAKLKSYTIFELLLLDSFCSLITKFKCSKIIIPQTRRKLQHIISLTFSSQTIPLYRIQKEKLNLIQTRNQKQAIFVKILAYRPYEEVQVCGDFTTL